ncbi:TPA: hypothetical protein L4R50_000098 [Pseudomonas aeruginosa]|nr:hypothetical protein [Pseudomonas aeruginosa]
MVLTKLEALGCAPLRIDAHEDEEDADFLWGELTPGLDLSAGEYMRIDQLAGLYSVAFGERNDFGGDPTWWEGDNQLEAIPEHASRVAIEFRRQFSNNCAGSIDE